MSSIEANNSDSVRQSQVSKLVIERVKKLYLQIDKFKQEIMEGCSQHCYDVLAEFSQLIDERDKAEKEKEEKAQIHDQKQEDLIEELSDASFSGDFEEVYDPAAELKCVAEIDIQTNQLKQM